MDTNNYHPYNDLDIDYTQYTDNSLLEDSFELDSKADTLLNFNQYLIEGFNSFVEKDSQGLISSYRKALNLLESEESISTDENKVAILANLGIACFYNNQMDPATDYLEEALEILLKKPSVHKQIENVQMLYIKCLVILILTYRRIYL